MYAFYSTSCLLTLTHHLLKQSFSNPHHEKSQLSPFEQTLRDQDEEFYNTFPGARIALQQDSSTQSWHPTYTTSGFLPGCGFQLSSIPGQDPFNYPYLPIPSHSLSQATSQSLPSGRLDASYPAYQTAALHPTPLEENHQTSYVVRVLSSIGETLQKKTEYMRVFTIGAEFVSNRHTP